MKTTVPGMGRGMELVMVSDAAGRRKRMVRSTGTTGSHATLYDGTTSAPATEQLPDGTWRIAPARPVERRRPRRVASTVRPDMPGTQASGDVTLSTGDGKPIDAKENAGVKNDATRATSTNNRTTAVGTLTMRDGLLVGMTGGDETRMPDIPSLIIGDDVSF